MCEIFSNHNTSAAAEGVTPAAAAAAAITGIDNFQKSAATDNHYHQTKNRYVMFYLSISIENKCYITNFAWNVNELL